MFLAHVNIFVRGVFKLLKKCHGLAHQLRDVDCKLKSAFSKYETGQPEELLQPNVDTEELSVQTPKKYHIEDNIQDGIYPLTSSPIAIKRVCAAQTNLFSLCNATINGLSLQFVKRQ